jgi:hypothetical protein
LFAVLVVTLLSVLAILDVITFQELTRTTGRSLLVVIVLTAGAVALGLIVKLARRTSERHQ